MKLDAPKFGLAIAIVFAVSWVICSLFVWSMPSGMMQMSGHMVHADLGHMAWQLGWTGFFYGLVAWTVLSGVIGWAVAAVYNRLAG